MTFHAPNTTFGALGLCLLSTLAFAPACSDDGDGGADAGTETETDGGPTTTGDGDPTTGDGDPTTTGDGDGDGDPTGDGDPSTGDGDGDGDPSGDGDGDPSGDGDGDGDPNVPPEVQQDPTYEVEVTTHVYAQGLTHNNWGGPSNGTIDLLLDLYVPMGAPPDRPAIVMIHGGAFLGGTRLDNNIVNFAQYFAERGWVTMSIDYRLAGNHGTVPDDWAMAVEALPDQQNQAYALYPAARDAKAALRWLYANADTYDIDTGYVTSLGGSAGSYLALVLGITEPEDFRDELSEMEDSTLSTTNLGEDSEVHTIIDHWGGISHMQLLEIIDGMSRYDATDAPVSIVHGTNDGTVSFTEAEALRDAYLDTGVAHDFHPLEGAGHGAWGAMVDGMNLRELAFAFVVEQQGLTVLP